PCPIPTSNFTRFHHVESSRHFTTTSRPSIRARRTQLPPSSFITTAPSTHPPPSSPPPPTSPSPPAPISTSRSTRISIPHLQPTAYQPLRSPPCSQWPSVFHPLLRVLRASA